MLEILSEVAQAQDMRAYIWDDIQNWTDINAWLIKSEVDFSVEDIPEVLNAVAIQESFQNIQDYDIDDHSPALFIYPDFHLEFERDGYPLIVCRSLKWLAPRLSAKQCSLLMLSSTSIIPTELEDIVHIEEIPTPDLPELEVTLNEILSGTPSINPSSELRNQVGRAALGLSRNQSDRLFAKAIVTASQHPEHWVDLVTQGKKGVIQSSGSLEFYPPDECPNDLGGLENLKKWLELRKRAYTEEAEAYHLPVPKGVGLIGIPGTGKSLTAKFIANTWHLPLLRFDIGAVFGSYVGQSEENMRKALQLAETISPSILWIDEIEKAFPKDVGGGDAGTSMRVLGSFLTWMQEKKANVFVVATANDVNRLPPELLRKGRFDEIFFLDLPTPIERKEIFRIHIQRVKRDPAQFDLDRLVKKTDGFVGAEIEQLVKEGLYLAFSEEGREPTDADFLEAINNTVPICETRKADIEELRDLVRRKEVINASETVIETQERTRSVQRPKLDIPE